MFPAFHLAKINGKPVPQVIGHHEWLRGEFCDVVGKRGAAVIAARGSSSAASAANALVDHVHDLMTPGKVHSVAVKSNGNYGFDPEVWAGMPVKTTTPGSYEVITGLPMDDFAKQKIAATNAELVGERDTVKGMLSK
jgi:malate dehydrogenase